jgi:hypothetical protein
MTWTMVAGVVGGDGVSPMVEVEDWADGWLSPSDAMMPNMVEALMPAARVRAAAARWRRRAGRTRLPPATTGAAVLTGALVLGAIPPLVDTCPTTGGASPVSGDQFGRVARLAPAFWTTRGLPAPPAPVTEGPPAAADGLGIVALVAVGSAPDDRPGIVARVAAVDRPEARRAWSCRMRSARCSSVTDLPGAVP